MSRAYWLRSSVTEASRLEIAKGTESTEHQFQVLVPVLPSLPSNAPSLVSCVVTSQPFTSTRPQSHDTLEPALCSSHQVQTVWRKGYYSQWSPESSPASIIMGYIPSGYFPKVF